VDNARAELSQLYEDLRVVDDAFWEEWRYIEPKWHLSIGPIRVQSAVGSQLIVRVFILFNAACFAAGIALVLAGGLLASIGVALIVGVLFSFGAFITQFWAVATQAEHELSSRIHDEGRLSKLQHLASKRAKLMRDIDKLIQTYTTGDNGAP